MDDRLLVVQLCAWMEQHLLDDDLGSEIVRTSGYSENRLRQKFYNVTGDTPAGYLRKRRLSEAARALMEGRSISDVALDYGYSSQDNFSTAFKAYFGLKPGEIQNMDTKYKVLAMRIKEPLNIMQLSNLKQAPLCTTIMSSIKGASDYFELDWSTAKLFGYSSHAFAINVKSDLCPSSPYVWNKDKLFLALRGMGIRRVNTIELKKGESAAKLNEAEVAIKAHLDAGKVAIMDYLEHQLIAGYDSKGFLFLKPWEMENEVTLPALSFGTWSEALDKSGWVQFTLLEKDDMRESEERLLASSLQQAISYFDAGSEYEMPGYGFGQGAWQNWIAGVEAGHGTEHGHWWTGCVWSECRSMAAEFFGEIQTTVEGKKSQDLCGELRAIYTDTSSHIGVAKEKNTPKEIQIRELKAAFENEKKARQKLAELSRALIA